MAEINLEELAKRLAALEASDKEKSEKIASLQSENKALSDSLSQIPPSGAANNDSDDRLAMLEEGIGKLQTENKALALALSSIGETKESLEKKAPLVVPDTIFTVGNKKYKFLFPIFNHDGTQITATDALADDDILKALVKRESGLIKEIVGPQ